MLLTPLSLQPECIVSLLKWAHDYIMSIQFLGAFQYYNFNPNPKYNPSALCHFTVDNIII